MDSFERELAKARAEVQREHDQACAEDEERRRSEALFKSLFDSTLRKHLPQLMREVKPYARGEDKVWVIRDQMLGVDANGNALEPVIRLNGDPKLGVNRSTLLDESEYQGRVTTMPFHYGRAGKLNDDYSRWTVFEDEIWFGTKDSKTKLITYIARAIARG